MTVQKTTQVGHPTIRSAAKRVNDVTSAPVQKVTTDLVDSMREHNLVGMAAPQIDQPLRIFVTELRQTKLNKSNKTS